jgi:hypothetical protein
MSLCLICDVYHLFISQSQELIVNYCASACISLCVCVCVCVCAKYYFYEKMKHWYMLRAFSLMDTLKLEFLSYNHYFIIHMQD